MRVPKWSRHLLKIHRLVRLSSLVYPSFPAFELAHATSLDFFSLLIRNQPYTFASVLTSILPRLFSNTENHSYPQRQPNNKNLREDEVVGRLGSERASRRRLYGALGIGNRMREVVVE